MPPQHSNLIAYLRVSSEAQDTQLQRDALTTAGCAKFFEDKISSRKTNRPGLTTALDYLRARRVRSHGSVMHSPQQSRCDR